VAAVSACTIDASIKAWCDNSLELQWTWVYLIGLVKVYTKHLVAPISPPVNVVDSFICGSSVSMYCQLAWITMDLDIFDGLG